MQRKIWKLSETLAKAAVISNVHILSRRLKRHLQAHLGTVSWQKNPRPVYRAGRIRDNFGAIAWLCWETAMSEPKQQAIALWILLMLLLMVPWILE